MNYRLWSEGFLFLGGNFYQVWLFFLKLSCNTLEKKGIFNSIKYCRRIQEDFGNRVCPSHRQLPVYVDVTCAALGALSLSEGLQTGTEAREVARSFQTLWWAVLFGNSHSHLVFMWPRSCEHAQVALVGSDEQDEQGMRIWTAHTDCSEDKFRGEINVRGRIRWACYFIV